MSASPSPSNQSWLSCREATTLDQYYQSPWLNSSKEGGQRAEVPSELAVVTAAADLKNPHPRWVPWGDLHKCRRAIKCTCHPYPFGVGITCGPLWKGRSSPPCTVTLFVRTGICERCAVRTASVKIARPHSPRCVNHHHRAT